MNTSLNRCLHPTKIGSHKTDSLEKREELRVESTETKMKRNFSSNLRKRLQYSLLAFISTGAFLVSTSAFSGKPVIVDVNISKKSSSGSHTIMATVRHADSGWKHYADAIEISTPEGVVLLTRVLAHPHVNEQPFTRGCK